MDRDQLAQFLRRRREALRPEDVGLTRGPRRRTPGLRREEVAQLAGMSTDYLNRLEQARGPQPSDQMLSALARALHLSRTEHDHLFRLAGHAAPDHPVLTDHVSPGMLRILDRLQDTPAQVVSELGETLVQTGPARALLGDASILTVIEKHPQTKRFHHPEVGDLTLDCQTLLDTESGQRLLVFTAVPGTPDAERLALLCVIGTQRMATRV
ncbi:MAG: transcriptional regulator [Microbacterium sp.]|nr:transcriptional regulator [Microbacterium sp.]